MFASCKQISISGVFTLLVALLFNANNSLSQCSVNIGPPSITINCGESLDLSAMGAGNVPVLSTDFDNGQAGPGWLATGGAGFAQPCGPGVNNTPYYWASTAVGTPALTTVGFDVTCGATVNFDMVYSQQGGAAPCEGPDLPDEGVTFEYSIDGGVTWVTLGYWDPNGGNDPNLINWNTYSITIPPAAWGPNTMFQWIQYNSSGACCDNWGIDNVLIVPGLCGVNWNYDWSNIPGPNNPTQQTVTPMTTTEYSIILTNGVDVCYDTIDVIVNPLIADASTSAAALVCPNCADLDVVFTNNNAGSIIDNFNPAPNMLLWDQIENGTAGLGCNSMSGNALHFDGTGTNRYAATVPINATVCGMANFCLFLGNTGSGGAPCENVDAGENVVFEYSINGGATWVVITTYDQALWDANNNWQCFVVPLPPPAQTTSTMFRWRQIAFSSCAGCDNWSLDNVSIACAPPVFDYQWSPATGLSDPLIADPTACPLVPTTYTAVITDPATGCSATDNVFIDVVCSCTIANLTASVSQCENGNSFTVTGDFEYIENPGTGTIEVEITNASGTYTQTINGPFVNQQLTNYSISGIPADGSALTVNVYFSDDLACSAQINDVSPVLPTLTNDQGGAIYCPGAQVADITVDVTGNGPFTINYTLDGIAQTVVGAGPTISLGNTEGVYVITAVNDAGCTNTASGTQTISLQPVPTVVSMTGGDEYCQNVPVNDIILDLTGTGPWSVDYTIDGTLYNVNSATTPISLGNLEGMYQLTQISDANCSDFVSNTDQIIINPAPIVNAGVDFISCDGDAITLTATGAQSYSWDNGVTNGISFVPAGTTLFTVTGTDPNGCQDTDDILVTVEPLPAVSFTADQTIGCAPFPVVFTNTTPGNLVDCQWNFGNGTTGTGCNLVANVYNGSGTFDVTLTTTSFNGCVNSVTYDDYIYVEDDPMAGFIASTQQVLSLDTEVAFDNTTIGAVNYIWDFGDNSELSYYENPIHEFPGDQTSGYIVTLYAYSPIGCVDSAQIVIQVNEEVIFYIPNAFTPDDDEFNQHFLPIFTAGFDPFDFNLQIFNRWGEVVFESNDHSVGWDGTYHGRIVQDGTYTWRVEFKTISSDERMVVHGHVTIIR